MPENTVMPIDLRALAPAPVATHQRRDAEDEGKRRHQDRPEAGPRRLDRGFEQRLAVAHVQFERDLDDQDGVLGRQRDQQDEADLGIEVVVDPQRPSAPAIGPSSDSGTARITEIGAYQLSYCPASTR